MKTFMFVRPCAQGRGHASLTGHARAWQGIVEHRKMVVGAPGKNASIWRKKSGYNMAATGRAADLGGDGERRRRGGRLTLAATGSGSDGEGGGDALHMTWREE